MKNFRELEKYVPITRKSMALSNTQRPLDITAIEEVFTLFEIKPVDYDVPNDIRQWLEFEAQYNHLKLGFEKMAADGRTTLGDLRYTYLNSQAYKFLNIIENWSENDLIILERNGFNIDSDWSAIVFAASVAIKHTNKLPGSVVVEVDENSIFVKLGADQTSEMVFYFYTRIDDAELEIGVEMELLCSVVE